MKRKILSITLSLTLILGSLLLSENLGKSFAETDYDWNYCSGYLDGSFPIFRNVDFSPFVNSLGTFSDPYRISTAPQLAALSVLSNNAGRKRTEKEIDDIICRECKCLGAKFKTMKSAYTDAYDIALKKKLIKGSDIYDCSYLCDKNGHIRMGESFHSRYLVVDEDIDLSDYRWTPIGSTTKFEGNIDFQGHTVNGIRIVAKDRQNTDKFLGLFGKSRGSISNLTIGKKGYVYCNTYKAYFGNVVAYNLGKVINCENNLSIKTIKGKYLAIAGGIVGYNDSNGVVKNCHNKGNLSAASRGNEFVGGVIGESKETALDNISVCTNEGNYFIDEYGDAEGINIPDKMSCMNGIIGYVFN